MRRRLLIALVVVALLLLGADLAIRAVAEKWIGRRLETAFALSSPPSVTLHGFPFLVHLVQGRFPTASASGTDLRSQGVTFQSVQITLSGLAFTPSKLVSGDAAIRADSGSGSVTMTASQATAALRDQGIDVTVAFVDGQVRLRSPEVAQEVTATLSISSSGTTLVVRSLDPRVPLTLSVPLPSFVAGLAYSDVRVVGSTAVFDFTLDHPAIRVGG